MEAILALFGKLPDVIQILVLLMPVASAIAALTPTPNDDVFLGKAYKIVDWLALNFGKAKQLPNE